MMHLASAADRESNQDTRLDLGRGRKVKVGKKVAL